MVIPLSACNKDVTNYLGRLCLSGGGHGRADLRQQDLILNRSGRFGLSEEDKNNLKFCPKHRYGQTTEWIGGRRSTCTHPEHKGKRAALKQPRRVSMSLSTELYTTYNRVVPVGSAICNPCRKRETKHTESGEMGGPTRAQVLSSEQPRPSQDPESVMGPPAQPVATSSAPSLQVTYKVSPQETY